MDQNIYRHFTIEDSKLKWRGSLETLRSFVSSELNLSGKWTSPGGDLKVFTNGNKSMNENETVTIKWYQGKKVFLVQGDRASNIEATIYDKIPLISSIEEGEINRKDNTETQNLHTDNVQVAEAVNEPKVQIQQLMIDIKQNKISISNFESLCQNVQFSKNTEHTELCKLQHELEVIRRENETIRKENAQYLERMNNLAYIVSDLNTKIKILEEEKASLVTSVRLLNEDYRQIILKNNPPQECSKNISHGEKSLHTYIEDPTHSSSKNPSAGDATLDLPVITKIINHDKSMCTTEAGNEESLVLHNQNGMIATPRNNPSEQSVPEISAQNTKDKNAHIHNPRLFMANHSKEKPMLRVESNQLHATNRCSKNNVPCPFLRRRGHCIKGEKCDSSHLLNNPHKGRRTPIATPKHLIPCPFLERNGFCLKGINCNFLTKLSEVNIISPNSTTVYPL